MTSIENYVSNLFSGKCFISQLYYAVDKARTAINTNRVFYFTVNIPNIGTKNYNSLCLISLDNKSVNCSLQSLINEVTPGNITIDQYVTLLLYGRTQIQLLFQTEINALHTRSNNKSFRYIYKNPYNTYANVLTNTLTFNNATVFLDFMCESMKNSFDPTLLFPTLFL